jgi:hypothetical protein
MAQSIIVHALTEKRAEVSGQIVVLEDRIRQFRADLAHIDATLRLFDPEAKPAAIRAKRPPHKRQDGMFQEGEITRRCRDTLRVAGASPLSAEEIVRATLTDKGLDPEDGRLRRDLIGRFLMALHRLHRVGHVRKIGHGMGTRWTLPAIE